MSTTFTWNKTLRQTVSRTCLLVTLTASWGCATPRLRTFQDRTNEFEQRFKDLRFFAPNGVTDSVLSERLGCIGTDDARQCNFQAKNVSIDASNELIFSNVVREIKGTELRSLLGIGKITETTIRHIQAKRVVSVYIPQREITDSKAQICRNKDTQGIFVTGVSLIAFVVSNLSKESAEAGLFIGANFQGDSYVSAEDQQFFGRIAYVGFDLTDFCKLPSKFDDTSILEMSQRLTGRPSGSFSESFYKELKTKPTGQRWNFILQESTKSLPILLTPKSWNVP